MKRKFLSFVLVLGAVICGICTFDTGTTEVMAENMSKNQVPVISGTNEIQILKDASFSTDDILNRVYAMDYEDGDLTQEIAVVSNDVNTARAGTYSVVYEVADKDGGKAEMTTTVEVVESYGDDGQKIQKTLYTKESAEHLTAVELYRGYYHDRQHLGIYMNQGTGLKVRIANWESITADVTIDLLGDDSNVEKSYTIPYDGSWLTIPAEDVAEDLVPFIRTPQSVIQPVLEYYCVNDNMEELTYYSYGDDEDAFFAAWNNNDQQYAVVEGERITMLIPRIDKDSILNNSTTREEYQFKTIDEMLEYYKDVQEQYDEYAGLSYTPEHAADKNVRARYFLKADASGVGAAYYSGGMYMAENAESINGFLKKDWMSLHEVAHGYDTSIAYGDIPLVETINNILGHYYEKKILAEGDYGWSYLQDFELVEETYMNQLAEGKTFDDLEFDARLYCMLNLLSVTDAKEMMSELHHAWRTEERTGTIDFIVEHFSETSGYNLVPYFEEYGLYTSELVKSRIAEKNYPVLNHFAEHFADKAEMKEAKAVIGDTVEGYYGLVDTQKLTVLNKKGNIRINIQIDDMNQLLDKTIRVLDGDKEAAAVRINSSEVLLEDIPIGTYRIELPAAKTLGYYTEYVYVTVCEGRTTAVNAVYEKCSDNFLNDDAVIVLQGISDKIFSTVSVNIEEGTVTVATEALQPHYYFTSDYGAYAMIEILSSEGETLYSRSYIGADTYEFEIEEIEAPIGSRIRITHQEISGRVNVRSRFLASVCEAYLEDFDSKDASVEFIITEKGIKRADWSEEVFNDVRSTVVEDMLSSLDDAGNAKENRNAYQKIKAAAVSAISELDEETQEYYKTMYPYLYLGEVTVPTPEPTATLEPTAAPEPFKNPFADIKPGQYYYDTVLWAVQAGITNGVTATQFKPDEGCTRGQIVTFIWRAEGKPDAANTECTFRDVQVGQFYYEPMLWAVEKGVITGYSTARFAPDDICTRGQIVTMLWRAMDKPEATKKEHPFTDVAAGGYYYEPMLWAVENDITKGQTEFTFAPDKYVNRAETVTFLYRVYGK